MLHGCLEDYVDDIVVKSKEVHQHVDDLRNIFDRCRIYNLRINPLKCALASFQENSWDPWSIGKASISIQPKQRRSVTWNPQIDKTAQSFLGRVSYIIWFIPVLAELLKPFQHLLKKDVTFEWKNDQQAAFQRVKDVLDSSRTMVSLVRGLPLTSTLLPPISRLERCSLRKSTGLRSLSIISVDRYK